MEGIGEGDSMTDRHDPNALAHRTSLPSREVERASEITRLDQGVRKLVERLRLTERENLSLQGKLDSSDLRIQELKDEIEIAERRRRDVLEKIDELVGWIDNVTERSGAAPSAARQPGNPGTSGEEVEVE